MKPLLKILAMCLFALFLSNAIAENKFLDNISGNVSIEGRLYTDDPAFPKQSKRGGVSISVSPEYKYRTEDDSAQFTFAPYYRWDNRDDERTHGDIRQLDYVVAKGDWEFQVGIGKKFWGVTCHIFVKEPLLVKQGAYVFP